MPGAVEVIRGGDVIAYLGYNVAMRPWMAENGATVEKFLAAVSEADKWMRANPKQAAQVATRWIPGLKQDVAEAAMEFNIQQNDRRLSANNYRALWSRSGSAAPAWHHQVDVRRQQAHRAEVHRQRDDRSIPDLFSDFPPIPADVAIKDGYIFKP